ncbi:MAG: class I SAM-dependent methyltransferase [Rhodobacter sp.]|nr:class I SAM-dependent methyltransferase [Rhodobacter sp.]
MSEPDLHAAFALRTPGDCLRLYRDWAASYDAGFAAGMDYRLPAHVAAAFLAGGGTGPVLDVGAGTGLVGAALRALGFTGQIDGVDLSPQMLDQAREKQVYRDLIEADITRPLPLPGGYTGVVSSGTFTHGHVGPEAFGPMLAVAAPGALFALSVNLRVWAAVGFEPALADLAGQLRDMQRIEVAIYGAAAARLDPDHAGDRAMIVLFRKA